MRARRYLPELTARERATLHRTLREAIVEWEAEGFVFVGTPSKLRVAVLVARKLARPAHPVGCVPLPRGGMVKCAVLALHRDRAPTTRAAATPLPSGAGQTYLAPGAPVQWDDARIGIGAVFAIDSRPYIVTCGHVDTSETVLATSDGEQEIATLETNFFRGPDQLDAAVFEVNPTGRRLLADGGDAPTWCASFRTPKPADNGAEVTFWPSGNGAQSFVENVVSYSACVPSGVGCDYVMLPRCTDLGDSGSLLQFGSSYYALASERDGINSFFTPLATVKKLLESAGKTVEIWRPST